MRHRRVISLLTVWVFCASSALAAPPPATQVASQVSPAVLPVAETSGEHHATQTTGPVVVNWHFKNAPGSANLVVNPDGTYIFSGSYKRKEPEIFDILLGLKSSLSSIYLFKYVENASSGVLWSKHGQSAVLKKDFKTFDKHDWIGQYRLHLTAQGVADKQHCLQSSPRVDNFFVGYPSWTHGHCVWVYGV